MKASTEFISFDEGKGTEEKDDIKCDESSTSYDHFSPAVRDLSFSIFLYAPVEKVYELVKQLCTKLVWLEGSIRKRRSVIQRGKEKRNKERRKEETAGKRMKRNRSGGRMKDGKKVG